MTTSEHFIEHLNYILFKHRDKDIETLFDIISTTMNEYKNKFESNELSQSAILSNIHLIEPLVRDWFSRRTHTEKDIQFCIGFLTQRISVFAEDIHKTRTLYYFNDAFSSDIKLCVDICFEQFMNKIGVDFEWTY